MSSMPSDALDGTSWTLARVETGGDVLSRQPDTYPMLTFEDGRVTGSDGCNQINGTVQRMDGGLAFGPLAMTKRACAPDIEAVADPIGRALSDRQVQTEMLLDGLEMKLMADGTTLVYIRTGPEGVGPDTYDTSAELRCSAGSDALDGMCGARIVRNKAAGTSELWIANPAYSDMARYRVLTYTDGQGFSVADGSGLSVAKQGDASVVFVGGEYYLIPESVAGGD